MTKRSYCYTSGVALVIALSLSMVQAPAQSVESKDANSATFAQERTKQSKKTTATVERAAASNPVAGSGTAGGISKWTGVDGSNTFHLGNSNIFEDKYGKIGIGTSTPTSMFSVRGIIETTLDGYKFPDGTIQTTAGIANVLHDATLQGNSSAASPLGIAAGGVGTIHLANSAITAPKISNGTVLRSLNGLFDNVSILAGSNITVTPGANTLTLDVHAPLVLQGSSDGAIVYGSNNGSGFGVSGGSTTNFGVVGVSSNNDGVHGSSDKGDGVSGVTNEGIGVSGDSARNAGVSGSSFLGTGVFGSSSSPNPLDAGVRGVGRSNGALAGRFLGNVSITGNLSVSATKNFKIDHPLDPENKYLLHAAIESSEVLNVYSGNVTTDEQGRATVALPDWFEALNRDFRYQLTVLSTFAQAIVAEKVKNNRFTIYTNAPGVEVSWEVTGVRSDALMRKHPLKVEQEKAERERGYYLTPDAFDQPEERGIEWAHDPEGMLKLKQRRVEAEHMRNRKQPD